MKRLKIWEDFNSPCGTILRYDEDANVPYVFVKNNENEDEYCDESIKRLSTVDNVVFNNITFVLPMLRFLYNKLGPFEYISGEMINYLRNTIPTNEMYSEITNYTFPTIEEILEEVVCFDCGDPDIDDDSYTNFYEEKESDYDYLKQLYDLNLREDVAEN